jgi:hypothetical protein
MPFPAALRRTSALVGATALVTAAGISTGVLTGVASAAPVASTLSPNAVSNATNGASTFHIFGSGFQPTDTVEIRPTVVPTSAPNYAKEVVVIDGTRSNGVPNANDITFTANLFNAAPQAYDIAVVPLNGAEGVCESCLLVTAPGRPTVNAVAGNGAGTFTVTGTNFAKGAKVEWLLPDGVTVDPAMVFSPGTDSNTTHTTGYPSSTSLKGTYTATAAAAAGKHLLRVTNTDGAQSKNPVVEFWQPKYTSIAPNKIGRGASNIPTTVTGSGIRAGSAFSISQSSSTVSDITIGTATVTGSTSISAPVSVSKAGTASVRNLTVVGPDGGFVAVTGPVTITNPPAIDDQALDPIGQGGTATRTITGTGFAPGVTFSSPSDTGVTYVTKTVAGDGLSATVDITVAPDATVGNVETTTVTNPDGGSSDYVGDGTPVIGTPFLVTVNAAPRLTKVTPGATTAPVTAQNVQLKGTDFADPMTVSMGAGITVNSVIVSNATTATVNITVAGGTAAGPRDVKLTNGDAGTSTCLQCFGIDGLTISSSGAANTNDDFDLTFTASGATSFTGATAVTLSKKILSDDQPDIAGSIVGTPSTGTLNANFDLSNAAPGYYNAIVSAPSGVSSCTGCLHITGGAITVTAVNPNKGGIGATDFPITIAGTGFSHGETVTIPGVTVSQVHWVSPSMLTAKVTIPSTATAANNLTVTVANADKADGGFSNTLANGYSIVAAPTVTSTATTTPGGKALGQGATNQLVSVVGTGFSTGSTATFCTGVTAGAVVFTDATHIKFPVAVATDAPLGDCALTIVQSDNGGQSPAFAQGITVTPKPVPSLVAPSSIVSGTSVSVTISGQGFQTGSVVQAADIAFTNTTLNSDGTLTADAAVPANAAGGARTLKVNNPDGGSGTCVCKITIAKPTQVSLTTKAINPGQPVSMIIKGTAGDTIQVFAKTAPSTTYAQFRTDKVIKIGANGQVLVPITPRRNTIVYATDGGTASNLAQLSVRPAIALKGTAQGHAASFNGSIVPGVSGARVRLFSVSDGQLKLQAETFTGSNGAFSFPLKTYAAAGKTVQFLAQTTSNAENIAGQSPRCSVTFAR